MSISVAVFFTHMTKYHDRLLASMYKYLPDDIELTHVTGDDVVQEKFDMVVSHYGWRTYQPCFAFISPKAIVTEYTDEAKISYFTERDILLTYDNEAFEELKDRDGLNIYLWPQPVDEEIFYLNKEQAQVGNMAERDIDILCVADHKDYHKRARIITDEVGKVFKQVTHLQVGSGDAALKNLYNRAKFVISLHEPDDYRGGHEPDYYRDRRVTYGFETAHIEAMFCGATPIVFDVHYHRYWYGDSARYINLDGIEAGLVPILTEEYVPLTIPAIAEARAKFGASVLWEQFWCAVRAALGQSPEEEVS